MKITDFLLARIAEDEAIARAAYPSPLGQWSWRSVPNLTSAETRHIAQHDPARVLAECEAKRRIVELHQPRRQDPEWREMGQLPECAECGSDHRPRRWPCPTLRAIASVYADHSDYRDEWRP